MPRVVSAYRYMVVEGVIGVGKTTLVELLSRDFKAKKYLEIVEENPFLVKGFYEDIEANAFNTELFFLLSRFRQQRQLTDELLHNSAQFLISDYLFAKNRIFASITLKGTELEMFDSVFRPLNKKVSTPDLIIYLRASVDDLMRRIHLRDRSFERNMDPHYIEKLVDRYNAFFSHYDETEVLTIDASDVDFVFNLKSYGQIMNLIADRTKRRLYPKIIEKNQVTETKAVRG